jgi:hypothetical protein
MVGEFDSMVQVADMDGALNKDPAMFFTTDLVHPSDFGANKAADALVDAVRRLTVPTTTPAYGRANYVANSSPAIGPVRRTRVPGQIYLPENGGLSGTAYTMVAGDQFVIPFAVTETGARYDQMSVATNPTAPVATNSFLIGCFATAPNAVYPGVLLATWATLTVGTTGSSPSVRSLSWEPDPGLYWLALRVTSAGTTPAQLLALNGPNSFLPGLTASTGAVVTLTAGGGAVNGLPAGFRITGQGTATTWPTVFPAGAALVNSVPLVGMRAAAPA